MLCMLISYASGGTYSLAWTLNVRFFEKPFHGRFILTHGVFCQKSAERKSPRKYFFHISFWCLTWDTNPGFTSNKPTHYLLDCGDYLPELRIQLSSLCSQNSLWLKFVFLRRIRFFFCLYCLFFFFYCTDLFLYQHFICLWTNNNMS